MRKAMKDFTFSDGTFIPKGTAITAASRAVHYDEASYPNAHEFKPFRFADLQGDEEGVDHQYISTTPEYLAFGHGKRAWYVSVLPITSGQDTSLRPRPCLCHSRAKVHVGSHRDNLRRQVGG